jgi:hypothetical protein
VSRLALGLALATVSLGITAKGEALGHWSTASSIAKSLGGTKSGPRCTVVYPSSERDEIGKVLLADCEEELASVEKTLGARGPERLTAFFFADAAQKKTLMGAADTYIAKPWRSEVYLQMHAYPHPILGHEIAHVVAGGFGRGPFGIAGAAGGLWPNPGLIEGIAVAASPDDDDLTDAQWARAMLDLSMLPPTQRIFSFGFLGESAAKSYTVAGAFVDWVITTYGAEKVRAWYGGASIEALTGKTWPELDAAFQVSLARYTLSPEAQAVARARFGRPSVFGRRCPHVVDGLRKEADKCKDANQIERALSLYDEVLAKDEHDWSARFARGSTELRFADAREGKSELARLSAEEDTPKPWKDRAEEALADADFLDGRYEASAERYRRVAAGTIDEDFARTLEVKALGAELPDARAPVEDLLLSAKKHPTDMIVAAVELGAWSRASHQPLADYLIGRNLATRGWFLLASIYLDRVLEEGAPTPRIERETLRQRAICACALRDRATLARIRERVVSDQGPFAGTAGGRRDGVLRLIDRCAPP